MVSRPVLASPLAIEWRSARRRNFQGPFRGEGHRLAAW